MTKKRRQENLARLLEVEQEMLQKGKRLSKAFYAAKKYAQMALDQQMPLISDDNRFPEYRKEGLELIEN